MLNNLYNLWVYNPLDGKTTIETNEGIPKAFHKTHKDIRPDITHSGRLEGYIYPIQGGYRITTDDDQPVDDPFILNSILNSIKYVNGEKLPYV